MEDLIVLVADKNTEYILNAILQRVPQIENIKPFSYHIVIHYLRDPGIYNSCHEFLRPFYSKYKFAIVVFDKEGCGENKMNSREIEHLLENKLAENGWKDNAAVIVNDPEIENWVWVNSPHFLNAISWDKNYIDIQNWISRKGFTIKENFKPIRPKEALESVLKYTNTPRSSSIYFDIGSNASYKYCTDVSFRKLVSILKKWFQKEH